MIRTESGTVWVVEQDPDFSGWGSINPDYRKWEDVENEEFYDFATMILSVINPAKSNLKQQQKDKDLTRSSQSLMRHLLL